MKLFSSLRKSTQGVIDTTDSIKKLRETLDILSVRESYLEEKCQREVAEAKKKLANKNKKGAVICLKKKAGYLEQIEKLSSARLNIEGQLMTIESSKVNVEVMSVMKFGAETMQKMHKNMDIGDVDDVIEDIQEQMDISAQISDAISQPVGNTMCDDDDELLAELDLLEQEDLDAQLLKLEDKRMHIPHDPTKAQIPYDLSKDKINNTSKNTEDEDISILCQLEAEMAI